jgi:flagellar biosynthesis protein FlhB
MFFDDTSDRVLPASPRRRREAREQGHVWQSSDLASALTTGGTALLLICLGPALVNACGRLLLHALTPSPIVRSDQLAASPVQLPLMPLMGAAAALLFGAWLLAILARLLQVGPLLVPALAQPQLERISPAACLRRIFSADTFARGGLWLLRLIVVASLVWWTLAREAPLLAGLMHAPPRGLAVTLGQLLTTFVLQLAGGLLLVSALDALWQWSLHERRLQMTADEVRAERREASRPQIDRRRRQRSVAQPAEPLRGI